MNSRLTKEDPVSALPNEKPEEHQDQVSYSPQEYIYGEKNG